MSELRIVQVDLMNHETVIVALSDGRTVLLHLEALLKLKPEVIANGEGPNAGTTPEHL